MPGQSEVAAQANQLVRRAGRRLGHLEQVGGGVGAAPSAEDAYRRRMDLDVGVADSATHGLQGAGSANRTENSQERAFLCGRRLAQAGCDLADASIGFLSLQTNGAQR